MQKITTLKDFETLNKLGEGAFAEVFQVKRKEDEQVYAMKKIKLNRMKEKQRENALNQVRILASYNGEYIIGFKEAFYDDSSSTLCIVMEFAAGGDILKMVQNSTKKRTKISEPEIWKALVHITQGLKSLHDKKILHRDLKCANIFVTGDQVYKLGDLNVSKVLKKDLASTQTGTPYYASPQVWKDKPYGIKSDMWSLGCVLYEMAAQRPPFTATDLPGLYKKVCNGYFQRIPMEYSNDLANIISSLLKINPPDRPTTDQLLSNSTVHTHFQGELNFQVNEHEQCDQLLKTLKVNHRNLKAIQDILPKANYEGLRSSRVRGNSIEKKNQEPLKSDQKSEKNIVEILPVVLVKSPELPKQKINVIPIIPQSPSNRSSNKTQSKKIEQDEEKSKRVIENYLEMKRKFEEKQRERQIQRLKDEKQNLLKKRQRVLSACGLRNASPPITKKDEPILQKKNYEQQNQIPIYVPNSARPTRKEVELANGAKLPPKPNLNVNQSYKMPPKPSPLIPNKNNISVSNNPSQRDILSREVGERQKSKQNLRRIGENILSGENSSRVSIQNKPIIRNNVESAKIGRSNSVQKIVYPSWWMD